MGTEIQFAVGLTTGLLCGFSVVAFRPLAIILVIAAVATVLITLFQSNVPGLAGAFEHLGVQAWAFAPFSLAASLGVVLSATLVARR
jgi:predicted transporter